MIVMLVYIKDVSFYLLVPCLFKHSRMVFFTETWWKDGKQAMENPIKSCGVQNKQVDPGILHSWDTVMYIYTAEV